MLTAIEIENFKGIRDRVRVELKPITLLFGPNSAGKSTILHAIQYAREVFEHRNLDAHQTVAGGKFVDLGGFRNLVHGHDTARAVTLRFHLDIAMRRLSPFFAFDYISKLCMLPVERLHASIRSASVAVEIAHSELLGRAYVRRYAVEYDGRLFAEITHLPDRRSTAFTRLDTEHPALLRPRDFLPVDATRENVEAHAEVHGDIDRSLLAACLEEFRDILPYTGDGTLPLLGMKDGLPMFPETSSFSVLTLDIRYDVLDGPDPLGTDERAETFGELQAGLTQLVVGPGQLLREALGGFRYLGPVRETPPRDFTPVRFPEPSRWANGFAAWDLLMEGPEELVSEVSSWLSQSDRLSAGYRVERRRYKRLDTGDPLLLALISGRAFEDVGPARIKLGELPTETRLVFVSETAKIDLSPPEVGIGISQVLPVIVASMGYGEHLVLIEQPELHVHPRIQAELGDLFIEARARGPRRFVLETHSEHLILRILRRIRETGEGQGERIKVHRNYCTAVDRDKGRPLRFEVPSPRPDHGGPSWPPPRSLSCAASRRCKTRASTAASVTSCSTSSPSPCAPSSRAPTTGHRSPASAANASTG